MMCQFTRRLAVCCAAFGFVAASSVNALTLVVADNAITGITGLEIAGQRYDVRFTDGAFNAVYPAAWSGYGPLARQVAQALLAATATLQAAPNWNATLRPHGCQSADSCTVLIPEQADAAAPHARMMQAVEAIYSADRFSTVPDPLWPFDAATDTQYMPDMLYAIITPSR